jgi:CDP-2,3-bis-(O-geranylgeranyl)-sn-glycerol synthase
MFDKVIFSLLFFLPAGIANGTPVIVAKFPILKNLNYPLDFNLKFRGERILGSHKTIRGLIAGVLMGIVTAVLLREFFNESYYFRKISPIDFNVINIYLYGGLSGLGAVVGDAVKSFFKRRAKIKPGEAWLPFDQIDYIFGGVLFTIAYIQLDLIYYFLIFILYLIIHPATTIIGYYLKLKDSPI